MPLFNYYLQTEKEQINLVELLQASKEISKGTDADGVYYGDPIDSIRTRTQLKALRLILCNLVRYPNEPILYSRQHSKTIGHRFNPQQTGIKVIKTVVDELYDKGIVDKTDGDNAFEHREENSPAKLSEFKSYEYGLLLAKKLGITSENIYMNTGWSGPSPSSVISAIHKHLLLESAKGPTSPLVLDISHSIENETR